MISIVMLSPIMNTWEMHMMRMCQIVLFLIWIVIIYMDLR